MTATCTTDSRKSILWNFKKNMWYGLRMFMDAWDTLKMTDRWEFLYSIWLNQINRENMEIMKMIDSMTKDEVKWIKKKVQDYMKMEYLNFHDLYKKVHTTWETNAVLKWETTILTDKLFFSAKIPVEIKRADIVALEFANTFRWYKNWFEQWFWKGKPKITSSWESAYDSASTFFDNTITEEQRVRWSNIFGSQKDYELFQSAIDKLPDLIKSGDWVWYSIAENFHAGRFFKILWDADPELNKVLKNFTEFNKMFDGVYSKADWEHIMTAFYNESNGSFFHKIIATVLKVLGNTYKLLAYTLNPVNGAWMLLNTILTNSWEDYTFKRWVVKRFADWTVDMFMKENNILNSNLWWEIQSADYIWLNDSFWLKLQKQYEFMANVFNKTTWKDIPAEEVQRYARAIAWGAAINVPDIAWDYTMKRTAVMRVIADKWYDMDTFNNFLKNLPENDRIVVTNMIDLRASEIYKSVRWFDNMIAGNVNGKVLWTYMMTEWFLSSRWLNKMRWAVRDSFGRMFRIYRDTIAEQWNKLQAHANALKYIMQDENITWTLWLFIDTYNKAIKVKRFLENGEPEPKTGAGKILEFIETMSMMSTFFQGIESSSLWRLVIAWLEWQETWLGSWRKIWDQLQRDFLRQTKTLQPIFKQVRLAQIDPNRTVWQALWESALDMSSSTIRFMSDNPENYNWLDHVPRHKNSLSMLFQVVSQQKEFQLNASNMAKKMETKYGRVMETSWYENSLLSNMPLVKALAYLTYDLTSDEEGKKFMNQLTTLNDDDEVANQIYNEWNITWVDDSGTPRTMFDNMEWDAKLKSIDFVYKVMTTLWTDKWEVSVTDISWNKRTASKIEAVWNIIKQALWDERYNALNTAYMTNTVSANKDLYLALWAIAANKDMWLEWNDLAWATAYLVSYMAKSYYDQTKKAATKVKQFSPAMEYQIKENAIKMFGNMYINADMYGKMDIYSRYVYDTYPDLKNFFYGWKEWKIKEWYLVNFKWQLDQAIFVQMAAVEKFRRWDMDATQLQNTLVKQRYTMTPEWRIALNMYMMDEFARMSQSEEDTVNFNTVLWLSMRDIINDVVTNKDLQTKYPGMIKWLVNTVFHNDMAIWQMAEAWNMDEWSKAFGGNGSGANSKFKSNQALYKEFKSLVDNNRADLFKLTKLSDEWNPTGATKKWSYAYTGKQRERMKLLASNVWAAKSEELIKPRAQWKEPRRTFKWKLPTGRSKAVKLTKSKWKSKSKSKSVSKWGRKTKKS